MSFEPFYETLFSTLSFRRAYGTASL